jgi:DNA-binding Lrp family transcriptional regulator
VNSFEFDWKILRSLGAGVSLFTVEQLARLENLTTEMMYRRLKRLEDAGLLTSFDTLCRKTPPVTGPFLRWYPGDPPPNFSRLSKFAKERFMDIPPTLVTVFRASEIALRQLNIKKSIQSKRTQHTHEYGMSETYIFARKKWPLLVDKCWCCEAMFCGERGFREKVEDAHLVNPKTGLPMLAIEYAGTYPQQRFEDLHCAFDSRQIPYFLF